MRRRLSFYAPSDNQRCAACNGIRHPLSDVSWKCGARSWVGSKKSTRELTADQYKAGLSHDSC